MPALQAPHMNRPAISEVAGLCMPPLPSQCALKWHCLLNKYQNRICSKGFWIKGVTSSKHDEGGQQGPQALLGD